MEISSEDRKILEYQEQELWQQETRLDKKRMSQLLAVDFYEFGRSGRVYQRQDTLASAPPTLDIVLPLPEFNIRLLSEDVAQVTYNSAIKYDDVVEYTHRSSIWSRNENGWVMRFHQGTPYNH